MPHATALEKAALTAKAANLFFLISGAGYDLYRRLPDRRVWLGRRQSPEALAKLVRRCASHR